MYKLAFLSFLSLASLAQAAEVLTAAPVAEGAAAIVEASPKSEAELCAEALTNMHNTALAAELQRIVWDDAHIEGAIERMKVAREISTPEQESRIRSQLKLGALFASQGLLHEAVYNVFSARYKGAAEIQGALQSFKLISSAEEKGVLVAEVIERVTQYIPEIGADNLGNVAKIAGFINMNGTQLDTFRNKWLVYDGADNFVELLQDGIYSVLTSANEKFVADVMARGSMMMNVKRRFNTIDIPARPEVVGAGLKVYQIHTEDKPYYDTDALRTYLKVSSTAAKRFFIGNRMSYFTVPQLEMIRELQGEWWFKESLAQALEDEIAWRKRVTKAFQRYDDDRRDLNELQNAIERENNVEKYDRKNVDKIQAELMNNQDVNTVRDVAVKALENYTKLCDSPTYYNVVTKIVAATNSRLLNNPGPTIDVISAIVDGVHTVGMDPERASKIKGLMLDLAGRIPGANFKRAQNVIDRLKPRPPKYNGLKLPELEAEKEKVEAQFKLSDTLLQGEYAHR